MIVFEHISSVGKITMNHVKLIFWDLGGQQELRSLWDKVIFKDKLSVSFFFFYLVNILLVMHQ